MVTTFIAESGLVEPYEVTMPSEEGACSMDDCGLNNVCSLEVVVAGTGTWRLGGIDLGWQGF